MPARRTDDLPHDAGRPTRRPRGFTMVELMVVVAILGIVAALAASGFKRNPTGDDARKVAVLMATAYRNAVSGGTVSSTVVSGCGVKARARLVFTESAGRYYVSAERLLESPPADADAEEVTGCTLSPQPAWARVASDWLSQDVLIYAIDATAQTLPGTSPAQTSFSAPVVRLYFPDGTSEAMTVFLRHATDDNATRFRVVGMPLSPAPMVFQDW